MRVALALIKPRYHLSFAAVVAAALLFDPAPDLTLAVRLATLYVSFNLLFYTGIYIFNDLADARVDAAHPGKRHRPIAAGRVRSREAAVAAALLIAGGLTAAALLFPPAVVAIYALTLAINAAYSCGGRNLPYLDIALNSAPHVARFLMGVLLVGRRPPAAHLVAWFCLAAGVACVRRLVELDEHGASHRPSLAHYSPRGLSLAADGGIVLIAALFAIDGFAAPGFYAVALIAYTLFVLVARRSARGHAQLAALWLR
jgi:decaprenyl-phosphate phosphoribosyltransferase